MQDVIDRFFPCDGKLAVVAMDHGMVGAMDGFKNPKVTLEKVLEGEPDGILVTPNFARTFRSVFATKPKVRKVIRVDMMATSTLAGVEGPEEIQLPISDVEQALEVGGSAIISLFIYGREDKRILMDNIRYLNELSRMSHKYNIPHIVEVPFWGRTCPADEVGRATLLENACRVAFEFGADVIKAPYLNDREAFANLTSNLPIPVLVLGGTKMSTERDAFGVIKNALDDGARGIMFGRNIWQAKCPRKAVLASMALIHKGASVDEAVAIVNE